MYTSLAVCVHKRMSSKSCGTGKGPEIAEALQKELADAGLPQKVSQIYCFGMCEKGPNVRLIPGGPFFHNVDVNDLSPIIDFLNSLDDEIGA